MKDIVIVGAGKIGSMIAELLGGSGDYSVTVVDRSQHQLDRLETAVPIAKLGDSKYVYVRSWSFRASCWTVGA